MVEWQRNGPDFSVSGRPGWVASNREDPVPVPRWISCRGSMSARCTRALRASAWSAAQARPKGSAAISVWTSAGAAGDGKIKPTVRDHLGQRFRHVVMQRQHHLGMFRAKGSDGRRKERGDRRGRGPDPQHTAEPARMIAQTGKREVERLEQRRGLVQKVQPERCRGRWTAAAVKERATGDLLDLPHRLGQRRGHNAKPVSGPDKAALGPDCMDGAG